MSTTTNLPKLAPYAAPTEEERDWSGWLTTENYAHVAAALEARLVGRTFTQVMMWEYNGYERPEARSGCRIQARDRPGTEHGIKADVSTWKWAASGQRAHIGFSAGNYSLGFSSTLAEQPHFGQGGRDRLDQGGRDACFIRFSGMTVEFEELTPEGKIARVLLVVEPQLKHVQELINAAKALTGRVWTEEQVKQLLTGYYNRSDEEAAQVTGKFADAKAMPDLAQMVENAEWELERG